MNLKTSIALLTVVCIMSINASCPSAGNLILSGGLAAITTGAEIFLAKAKADRTLSADQLNSAANLVVVATDAVSQSSVEIQSTDSWPQKSSVVAGYLNNIVGSVTALGILPPADQFYATVILTSVKNFLRLIPSGPNAAHIIGTMHISQKDLAALPGVTNHALEVQRKALKIMESSRERGGMSFYRYPQYRPVYTPATTLYQ